MVAIEAVRSYRQQWEVVWEQFVGYSSVECSQWWCGGEWLCERVWLRQALYGLSISHSVREREKVTVCVLLV